jgi:hypothetical protein
MKRQFVENAALYRWSMLILILLIPLLFWLFIDWNSSTAPRVNGIGESIFVIACIICPVIFGGTYFESIASKHKSMFYFSLPVSASERLATAFSFAMIIFPAICFTLLAVCDTFSAWLYHLKFDADYPPFTRYLDFELIYITITLISVFVLGSFIFGKISVIKTGVALVVLMGLFQGLIKLIFPLIIQGEIKNAEFEKVMIEYGTEWKWIQVDTLFNHMWYLIAPLCWIILYFKIKEREA